MELLSLTLHPLFIIKTCPLLFPFLIGFNLQEINEKINLFSRFNFINNDLIYIV